MRIKKAICKWTSIGGLVLAGIFLFKNSYKTLSLGKRIPLFDETKDRGIAHKFDSSVITMSYKGELNMNESDVRNELPTLTLFTTLKDVRVRRKIHNTMLINWAHLAPALLPVLFVTPRDDPTWSRRAEELGWKVEEAPRMVEDVPVLKDMFQVAAHKYPSTYVGFANADNIFGNSLITTLDGLTEHHGDLVHQRKSLIVGRRRNVKESLLGKDDFSAEFVDKIAPNLELHHASAQDYFILSQNSGFCWENVPDFVVGRIAYDNWLVAKAQYWGLTLIDATNTINDVHLVGIEGVASGFRLHSGKSKDLNKAQVPKDFHYKAGIVTCSQWNTVTKLQSTNGSSQSGVFLERNNERKPKSCRTRIPTESCGKN